VGGGAVGGTTGTFAEIGVGSYGQQVNINTPRSEKARSHLYNYTTPFLVPAQLPSILFLSFQSAPPIRHLHL
jgi:hypothetical protein